MRVIASLYLWLLAAKGPPSYALPASIVGCRRLSNLSGLDGCLDEDPIPIRGNVQSDLYYNVRLVLRLSTARLNVLETPDRIGRQSLAKDESTSNEAGKARPKADIVVVQELCKGCELCVYACPSGNLTLSPTLNRKGYHPAVFSYQGTRGTCTACGICYWVCPDLAIAEVRRLKQ